jgi:hypothetical protein
MFAPLLMSRSPAIRRGIDLPKNTTATLQSINKLPYLKGFVIGQHKEYGLLCSRAGFPQLDFLTAPILRAGWWPYYYSCQPYSSRKPSKRLVLPTVSGSDPGSPRCFAT